MANHFEVEKHAGYVVFRSKEGLTDAASDELFQLTERFTEETSTKEYAFVVLDVNNKKDVSRAFLRMIVLLQRMVRSFGKELVAIGADAEWLGYVKAQGISLVSKSSLQEVVASLPKEFAPRKASAKVDVAFVNPFIDAAVKTLQIQCSMPAKAGKPFIKGQGLQNSKIDTEIAGVIGLTSKAFAGSIAIAFPAPTFLAVMSNMLGEKYTEITKDLEDGAGELLNIIFGQAKVVLNEKNYAIEKAIPTVVRGKDLAISHVSGAPTVVVPFETDHGPFQIEISVKGEGI